MTVHISGENSVGDYVGLHFPPPRVWACVHLAYLVRGERMMVMVMDDDG